MKNDEYVTLLKMLVSCRTVLTTKQLIILNSEINLQLLNKEVIKNEIKGTN